MNIKTDKKRRIIDVKELTKYEKRNTFSTIPSLEEWLLYWIDTHIKNSHSSSTYANFKSYCVSHIIPFLGDMLITELDYRHFQYYIDKKLESGRLDKKGGLSIRTVKEHILVLKSSFHKAVEFNLIALNPCINIIFPKELRNEIRVLTIKEQIQLTKDIQKNWKTDSTIPSMVALYGGLRIGEVAALRLDDIDLMKGMIRVDESLNRFAVYDTHGKTTYPLSYGSTKTKKIRKVPMCQTLYKIMEDYMDTIPEIYKQNKKNPLFMNKKGKAMEPRILNYHFRKLLKRHDIDGIHFHSLRHTFATRALESSMNIKYCSAILGHSSTTITENLYIHATYDQLYLEIQKLDIDMNC